MTDARTALPAGYKPGLEDVIAGTSAIAEVDPQKDQLIYHGYAAHELAEKATYEEVSYLLLYGKLPNVKELQAYRAELLSKRRLSPAILSFLKQFGTANTMIVLRAAISLLYMEDAQADRTDRASNLQKATHLIASTPTIVAALSRIKAGQSPIEPNPQLGFAANFLYMALGKEPDAESSRVFDSTAILYAEHGYNASTFAGLVTASTLSDMYSAICSAIGALKGPLHGGANEAAIDMLLNLQRQGVDPDAWVKSAIERKEKIMGFGHRVYKKQDSRAPYMKKLAGQMARRAGDTALFDLSSRVEEAVKREKGLFPNVDYHCAVAYYLMGLPIPIYTPIFAMARMSGWTAHVIEQHSQNRLIRPDCIYTGPRDLPFVPLAERE